MAVVSHKPANDSDLKAKYYASQKVGEGGGDIHIEVHRDLCMYACWMHCNGVGLTGFHEEFRAQGDLQSPYII